MRQIIQVIAAAQQLRNYLCTQVGATDEWPCEICFDDEEEANRFTRLVQNLDLALEEIEEMTF